MASIKGGHLEMKIGKTIAIAIGVFVLSAGGGMIGSSFANGEENDFMESFNSFKESFAKEEPEVTVPLEPFLTNLKTTDETKYALQIEMSIGVRGEENSAVVTEKTALIRDSIIRTLTTKTAGNVMDSDENNSLLLKEEVKDTLNQTLGTDIVTGIFVTNIVQQRTQ